MPVRIGDTITPLGDFPVVDGANVSGIMRLIGVYNDTLAYEQGHVTFTGSNILFWWVCADPILANANAPTIQRAAEDTGWELLTELSHWRGDLDTETQFYHSGDAGLDRERKEILYCTVEGDYTLAEARVSPDWTSHIESLLSHRDGIGEPTTAPSKTSEMVIDDDGRVYPSKSTETTVTTPPTITNRRVNNADWNFWNNVHTGNQHPGSVQNNVGHFYWSATYHYFYQNQGSGPRQTTWAEIVHFLSERTPPVHPPSDPPLQNRTWLGFFQSHQAAADQLARFTIRNDRNWLYIKEGGSDAGLFIVTAHTDGGVTRREHRSWRARLIDLNDAIEHLGVIDGRHGIPQPSSDYEGRFLYDPSKDKLEICRNRPHYAEIPTGTFNPIPERGDLEVARNRSDVSEPQLNEFVLQEEDDHFYRYARVFAAGNQWEQTTPTAALAASRSNNTYRVRWLHSQASDEDALLEIGLSLADNTDYFYRRGDVIERLDRSTFNAASEVVDHFVWEPVLPGEIFTIEDRRLLEDLARVSVPHPSSDWHLKDVYYQRDFNPHFTVNDIIEGVGTDSEGDIRVMTSTGRAAKLGDSEWHRIVTTSMPDVLSGVLSQDHWIVAVPMGDNITLEDIPEDGGTATDITDGNNVSSGFLSLFVDQVAGSETFGWLNRVNANTLRVHFATHVTGTVLEDERTVDISRQSLIDALAPEYGDLADIVEGDIGVVDAIMAGDEFYLVMTEMVREEDQKRVNVLIPFTVGGDSSNTTLTQEGDVIELAQTSSLPLKAATLPPDSNNLYVATDHAVYRLTPRPPVSDVTWDNLEGTEEARPPVSELISGDGDTPRPWAADDVRDMLTHAFPDTIQRVPSAVLSGDDVIAQLVTGQVILPARDAARDLRWGFSNTVTVHEGLSMTDSWLYQPAGADGMHRYRVGDIDRGHVDTGGLAASCTSLMEIVNGLAAPFAYADQIGPVVEPKSQRIYIARETGLAGIASVGYDDEETAQSYDVNDLQIDMTTFQINIGDGWPIDFAVLDIDANEVTGVDEGTYFFIARRNSSQIDMYRRQSNGTVNRVRRLTFPTYAGIAGSRRITGVAANIVDDTLVVYAVGETEQVVTLGWRLYAVNGVTGDQIAAVNIQVDENTAGIAINGSTMYTSPVSFRPSSTRLRAYHAYSFLEPGTLVRGSVGLTSSPAGEAFFQDPYTSGLQITNMITEHFTVPKNPSGTSFADAVGSLVSGTRIPKDRIARINMVFALGTRFHASISLNRADIALIGYDNTSPNTFSQDNNFIIPAAYWSVEPWSSGRKDGLFLEPSGFQFHTRRLNNGVASLLAFLREADGAENFSGLDILFWYDGGEDLIFKRIDVEHT